MRRRARVDGNHSEIVKALRAIGASVQSLAEVGDGCPDLLVGYRGRNYLIEVKDGAKPPSARKLTQAQTEWGGKWAGAIAVVYGPTGAIATLLGPLGWDGPV